ncbi:hypothetical protein AcV5_008598 [Taiwanofungus camphoratus]|nr:hypothetical protein AcV5_008598 [Antrodia cinnamomea]
MLCNVHVFTWIRSTSINYALKPSCSGRNLMPFGGMIQNNNRSVSQYTGYVSCNEEQLMIRQSSAIDVISAIWSSWVLACVWLDIYNNSICARTPISSLDRHR